MRGIKKCPTVIYRLKKYRDTGIPRYFVTSSIVNNFCKNPTVRIICYALTVTASLCHIYVKFLAIDVVVMLLAFMLRVLMYMYADNVLLISCTCIDLGLHRLAKIV